MEVYPCARRGAVVIFGDLVGRSLVYSRSVRSAGRVPGMCFPRVILLNLHWMGHLLSIQSIDAVDFDFTSKLLAIILGFQF